MSGVNTPNGEGGEPLGSQAPEQTADLGLGWAVKTSFVQYIQRSRGGRVWVADGAAETNTDDFYFPLRAAEVIGESVVALYFVGTVSFVAHMGMLSLRICSPRVEIDLSSRRGILSVERGEDILQVAHVRLGDSTVDGAVLMWPNVEVALTETGVEFFESNYAVGESMSPLTLRVPREVFPLLRH